jgi:hypothetical protein
MSGTNISPLAPQHGAGRVSVLKHGITGIVDLLRNGSVLRR